MKYKEYLSVAIPLILSTVTIPLLGAVDTAVIGYLDKPYFIASVAIGAIIFNTIYWLFGFLRVSTSGFSAQAIGSKSNKEEILSYLRPLFIAFSICLIFLIAKSYILKIALYVYKPEEIISENIKIYFDILIWGSPFVLIGYVNLGWIMGRKLIKETLFLQISTNLLNIFLDILFVLKFKMKVDGVAYASLISQIYSFLLGLYIISKHLDFHEIFKYKTLLFNKESIYNIFKVNSDLMIRTCCLLLTTNLFIMKGNSFGVNILAANAILFQLQYIVSYFFDGLGNTSSIFVGEAVGEQNFKSYKKILKISNVFTILFSILISLFMLLSKDYILGMFTRTESIIDISSIYFIWIIIFPFVIGPGLVYYGIFSGATFTAPIRNSMLISVIIFVSACYLLIPKYGNHGLWLSFILFSLGRSIFLYVYKNSLIENRFNLKK